MIEPLEPPVCASLNVRAVLHALAVDGDDFAQRDAHRHFDQAGDVDVAQDGVDLGAGALGRAERPVPVRAPADDRRDVRQRLDVVDERGLAPQAVRRGIRRPRARFAALALDRFDQRGLFAADVRARAGVDVQIEVEVRAKDILAQQVHLAGLLDGASAAASAPVDIRRARRCSLRPRPPRRPQSPSPRRCCADRLPAPIDL